MRIAPSALLVALFVALSSLAAAPVARAEEPPMPNFSLTVSPIHLTMPVVEVTGEHRLGNKVGLAWIGGAGTMSDDLVDYTVWELGGQARYYVVGTFRHGMQIGAEALWINISGDLDGTTIEGSGQGLAVGPFVGYKYAAGFGLTVDVQLGFESLLARADAENTATGETSSGEDSDTIVLLNLNLGWSF